MKPVYTTLKQVGKKFRLISDETGGVLRQMGPRKLSEARANYRKEKLAGEEPEPVGPKCTVSFWSEGNLQDSREFLVGDHITFPEIEESGVWNIFVDSTTYTYDPSSGIWDPEELLVPNQAELDVEFAFKQQEI